MRIAAVTGAGSGIGRGICLALARRGYVVAASDISEASVLVTADLVRQAGGTITTRRVDVTKPDEVNDWAREIRQEHGDVSAAFNNAGVSVTGTFESMTQDDFDWLFAVNWWGVVYGTRAFLPQLKASAAAGRPAHLVNVSSIFGIVGIPSQSAYCAAKAAVRGFTETLSSELHGTGVTAHCVHPGAVATRIAEDAKYTADVGPISASGARKLIARGMAPDRAGEIIVDQMERGRERILVGTDAGWLDRAQRWFPSGYKAILRRGARFLR